MNDESKYRQLVEAVTDYAIYLLTPSGHISSWNAGAERFKGYRADEIIGQHFSRFYTDEDRDAGLPERALATAAREGRFEAEGWRIRKDGTRFWAHVVIDPVHDDGGKLVGFATITRDLSERQAADEALRRSQEQFRLLVQGVADYAIYMLDLDGRITSWNAGAERIKGYKEAEVLGRHLSTFYTAEDVAAGRPQQSLSRALRDGMFESESWRVRKDGTRFLAHVVIDRIDDDDGKPIGFAKITRDVTEKKRAEQALATAREALFQSQKSEAIGQLTGGVAHDFNNLLMAVMSSLELLRKWVPQEPRPQALLANAMAGAERGAALTQRMLAFARRQELRPEPTDVPVLVDNMAGLLQRSLGPQVRIQTQFTAALPPVLIDANQLELVLLNLAVNGRDAMPAGGDLVIGARAEQVGEDHSTDLAPGHYVCLWVTDHGHGMDAQTLQRATEPFFTTKGVGKGTGLGLSMAHGLAEQSGGRLRLESEPGVGTAVQIWLPVTTLPVQPAAPASEAAPSATGRMLAILVVDDDDLVLRSAVALLQDLGHRAIGVDSGTQALEALERGERPDLVITDQAMPGMTGVQLAAEIRQVQPRLPVVLASGYADLAADQAPDLTRLTKPFNRADLRRAIEDALGRATGADTRRTRPPERQAQRQPG